MYQIEATIEKIEQKSVQLKGTGKYLFEKSSENKKDKEYWNIFEEQSNEGASLKLNPEKCSKSIDLNSEFKDLLIHAFIEKKKLKFDLECEGENENKKYTITAVSHAGD